MHLAKGNPLFKNGPCKWAFTNSFWPPRPPSVKRAPWGTFLPDAGLFMKVPQAIHANFYTPPPTHHHHNAHFNRSPFHKKLPFFLFFVGGVGGNVNACLGGLWHLFVNFQKGNFFLGRVRKKCPAGPVGIWGEGAKSCFGNTHIQGPLFKKGLP